LQNTAIIRLVNGRLAWYAPGASEEPRWLDDEQVRDSLFALMAEQRNAPCFAVPGADVRLLSLGFTAEEKKHIGKSLPFMLEERVAEDIEQLHFASVVLGKLELGVALCSTAKMQDWQDALADIPGIRLWLPEPLLLPWRNDEWCIVLEDDEAIVRFGECDGFTVERGLLPAMLAGLQSGQPQPGAVIMYGGDQAADTALLPDDLQENVQWRRGNLYSALLLGDTTPGVSVNLLQGSFANRLPLARWWQEWRAVAAIFALAFGLQWIATYSDYRNLAQENLALRSAVLASFRQTNPKGNAPDPEKQLHRQLIAMRGSGDSSGFVHLMEQVGAVIAGNKGTSIDTINYNFNTRGGEMRMNILAADFEAVERVRADINSAGLEAVMESSSAQGDKVRARLRVGEKS
jgi:general secretion pathway protein L